MVKAVKYERNDTDAKVILLDQRALPSRVIFVKCLGAQDTATAIKEMVVRGAPAIGIAAAYALAAEAWHELQRGSSALELLSHLTRAGEVLIRARPTAVNLAWAVKRVLQSALTCPEGSSAKDVAYRMEREAKAIDEEDLRMNRAMADFGAKLLPDQGGVLTHCNAGALATGGYGTALGVIRRAYEIGKRFKVYADETRPLMQGARLTAWELMQDGIPVVLITDSSAAYLMQLGRIQCAIVGADRIAANGDVANKIGTYAIAVSCRAHGIPFYVAAPSSTVDLNTSSGREIVVEERSATEITTFGDVRIAPEGIEVFNPAFDITPARYVTAIITDKGIVGPPFDHGLRQILGMHDTVDAEE
ncbi:MAG TPA: S-methyl-5-thioribose-1-phosphate isomerase [Firmicutes bacterium]|nr:S-methyl-5-thioribose-1-phosphate isomerase [Bacillota bacterium]